ncbi:MAG: DegT/DnrJ/EryC1/StrS family aminotransferase [Bryobacterales bacterium]|nr:DegT/DnrJ/EryC1/StrS family aminotransferase [Bryobacterales bacterium]
MTIQMVNFGALLAATKSAWEQHLSRLFEKQQFILGEQVAGFEQEFSRTLEARHTIAVGNGTAAIELALRDAGINSPKQEVITSALTAPFTGIGIVTPGASIRFADVDPNTLLIDLNSLQERITRRTAAIVPVHLYGQPCNARLLKSIAAKAGAVLIQDACQAHGARFEGKPLTAYSPYVAYSFYPTKNLGALGDGGAILTNVKTIDARLRMLRDGGRRGGQVAFVKGINSRLDEMQACYLRAFLPHLAQWNANRARLAALYLDALQGIDGVQPLETSNESVWHLFVVRAKKRDKLRHHLTSHGVATGIHYPVPLHLMPAYKEAGLKKGDLPVAEKAAREIVSLPLWPLMPDSSVDEVVTRIRAFYRQ